MFIPMLQKQFEWADVFPLKGDVALPAEVKLHDSTWFSGEYQKQEEDYVNSMFGFRPWLVKLNNQIAYSFFNKVKANAVVIGKNNYLFEESYINAYTGRDFLGEDSIRHTLERLKFISDTLNKLNKQLIVVFAPGKASFYPEYIPDKYLPIQNKTNYQALSSGAEKLGLNVIDFNKWFIENKSKSKYPLYPQHGIHWSTYGTALAVDSLIKKIESLRHIDVPTIYFDKVVMMPAYNVDYDIADGMNLLFKLKGFDCAYPQVQAESPDGKTKPKVLVISDSFYWGMYDLGIANCFQDEHFWYYNKQVYPETFKKELLTEQLNVGKEIEKHEVIVIMATEATLRKISWGFIEDAEKYYKGIYIDKTKTPEYYQKVKDFITFIKKDSKWMEDTKKRAEERKINLDSALVLEAMWQVDLQK